MIARKTSVMYTARAALLSLVIAAGLAIPLMATANRAAAEELVSQTLAPHSIAMGWSQDIKLAQQAPVSKAKKKVAAEGEGDDAQVRTFIMEKTKWIRELPGVQTFLAVMPQMWMPIKLALALLFLAFYVGFHFKRQLRNRLEDEQNRKPSAHEAEFGIVADPQGKEVSP